MSQRGTKNNEGSNIKYLAMSDGKFVQRVAKPMTGEEMAEYMKTNEVEKNVFSRELKKGVNTGKSVLEKRFDQFTGQLIKIEVENHDQFGMSWAFKFDVTVDQPEFIILKLPYSSGYSNNILTRLPNVKSFDNDVTLKGYKFTPSGEAKERMGISMFEVIGENESKITPFYTRENPNGIPQMVEKTISGKKVWDDSDRLEFLHNMVNETISPKLSDQPAPAPTPAPAPEMEATTEEDDLPF